MSPRQLLSNENEIEMHDHIYETLEIPGEIIIANQTEYTKYQTIQPIALRCYRSPLESQLIWQFGTATLKLTPLNMRVTSHGALDNYKR